MKSLHTNLRALLLAASALALSGCFGYVKNLFTFSSTGEFQLQQSGGETQHLLPDVCRSGELSSFRGFDFSASKSDWQLRALIDPLSGPAVKFAANGSNTIFHQEDCSVLGVDARPSGLSINEVNSYDGFVELNCTSPAGLHVQGRVDVHNCPGGYMNGPLSTSMRETSATSADLARIHAADVVRLHAYYDQPDIPQVLQRLTVWVTQPIPATKPADPSAAQLDRGCAQAAADQFEQMGWHTVFEATQAHNLIARIECTSSVEFLTQDNSMYVLLPPVSHGIRWETPAGDLIEQQPPSARTLLCPVADQTQCALAIKAYAAHHLMLQVAQSMPLRSYMARRRTIAP
jgi:hypothetical protein